MAGYRRGTGPAGTRRVDSGAGIRHWQRAAAAALGALVLAVWPAGVTADPLAIAAAPGDFSCDASALRGNVLGTSIEPVTANRGASVCQDALATLSNLASGLPIPAGLLGGLAQAQTAAAGSAGQPDQTANSVGALTNLSVDSLPSLPITIPAPNLSGYSAVSVPLPAAVQSALVLLGVNESSLTLNLVPELQALLPSSQLPTANLFSLQTAVASASAHCVSGAPQLAGTSQLSGLSVLGTALPTGQAVNEALTLVPASTVSPSSIQAASIPLPSPFGSLPAPALQATQSAIQGVLDGLPPVKIPAVPLNVSFTPGGTSQANGVLTQQAGTLQLGILGQNLADMVLGEARVAQNDVRCSPGGPSSSTKAAGPAAGKAALSPGAVLAALELQCTDRKVTLIDVLRQGGRVKLLGAANRIYAGRPVQILFGPHQQHVATVRVQPDGSFQTFAPLPPVPIRDTNAARYVAVVDGQRSLNLKLDRRMIVDRLSSRAGKVTIAGRVTPPLLTPRPQIVLERRLTCNTNQVVGRFRPSRTGAFSITVPAPKGLVAAVYRMTTRVRHDLRNPHQFPTFTLPRAVNLIP